MKHSLLNGDSVGRWMRLALGIAFIGLALAVSRDCLADDWPQWLGPQRNGHWQEEGIIDKFPADGLPVKWRAPVGLGYSGPAIADGKVFLMDYQIQQGELRNSPSSRNSLQGKERVLCLDASDGSQLWTYEYDCPYNLSYANGPRATPAVADGKVYCLGAEGNFSCVDIATGKPIWTKDFQRDYEAETPFWGFCSHPLVYGENVYCLVGGSKGVVMAFNKDTGAEVWSALSARSPGYCPPMLIEAAETPQLVIWHPESINGLNPQTGEVYWTVPLEPSYEMSVTAPQRSGDFLYASGIGNTAILLKLDQQKPAVEIIWRGDAKSAVYCCNSTPILEQDTIYGVSCQTGHLRGVDLQTGERLWETFQPVVDTERRVSHGTAFLVKNADRYFIFNEEGDLVLGKLSRDGFQEISRFHVLEPTTETFGRQVVWSHPAFANRSMYARNDKELVCVSLAEQD